MKTARRRGSPPPKIAVNGITPFLWFDDRAEEAAKFYVSIFRNSRIIEVGRIPGPENGGEGKALTVTFELAGQSLMALNGGPVYRLTPSFSLFVSCSTQRHVDALWTRLTRGGKESRCGWLEDRFGVSWQIIPTRLPELLGDPDPARAGRAMSAMMKMKKIDVATLNRAANGTGGC
jgi:predicted 3-demethylubiquinone-9 3-methyltransferase (glyoxalase superfamily)